MGIVVSEQWGSGAFMDSGVCRGWMPMYIEDSPETTVPGYPCRARHHCPDICTPCSLHHFDPYWKEAQLVPKLN